MSTLKERKHRGEEILKKYRLSGVDPYARAVDAIADILLCVAQTEHEGSQLLQSAEIDFRNAAEGESFVLEG